MNSAFIQGPKQVVMLELRDGSFPCAPDIDAGLYLSRIYDLAEQIEAGTFPATSPFYRQSSGRDYLLEDKNWIHLHIGQGIDDDVLLIVEQTHDRVIFISLARHRIFIEKPRGKSLMGLGSKTAKAKLQKLAGPAATSGQPSGTSAGATKPIKNESFMRMMINLVTWAC